MKAAQPPVETVLPGAFARIYEEHAQVVYYFILRMLGDPAAAEDAMHDVFLKAFRKLDQFRGQSSIRTWLYRIALNHCRNLRQSWHQRHIDYDSDSLVETRGSGNEHPLRVLEIRELGERIQQTLERLPEEYRLLLLMVADEELSYDEVAQLTCQSADAVRGKLYRARKVFARLFKQSGDPVS